MQAQAYEGYFEKGTFFTAGKPLRIPEYRKVYITILDESTETSQISDVQRKKPRELMFGYLSGEYTIANDFDAPLEDFREYME